MNRLKQLQKNFRSDILSGFIISLIALPLCLGIADAAGAPPISGLIAAIIAGPLASLLGGGKLTIHGPAAGLIVIVIAGIQSLGALRPEDPGAGFRFTLAALVVAGLLQILVGVFRLARYAAFFPSSVIHGMMTSIGIIILCKQVHILLGASVPGGVNTPLDLYAQIPHSILNADPKVAGIGLLSLAIMLGFPYLQRAYKTGVLANVIKRIPLPLLTVTAGFALAHFSGLTAGTTYELLGQTFTSPAKAFVDIPVPDISDLPGFFRDHIPHPDFSVIFSGPSLFTIFALWSVASLESLLSAAGVQKLDSAQTETDFDREIMANGLANTLIGFAGGFPIIAEIVRSRANIDNGAKSPWSDFFHGIFLAVFLLFLAPVLQKIPRASLAAILVVVGYRLANPKQFWEMFHIGSEQLFLYTFTIIIILVEDILVGVGAGLVLKLFFQNAWGVPLRDMLRFDVQVTEKKKKVIVKIRRKLTFLNLPALKSLMAKHPESDFELDFSMASFVDHTSMEFLHELIAKASRKKIKVTLTGLEEFRPQSAHPDATRVRD